MTLNLSASSWIPCIGTVSLQCVASLAEERWPCLYKALHRQSSAGSLHQIVYRRPGLSSCGPDYLEQSKNVTSVPSQPVFRQRLKTYPFSSSFPDIIYRPTQLVITHSRLIRNSQRWFTLLRPLEKLFIDWMIDSSNSTALRRGHAVEILSLYRVGVNAHSSPVNVAS